MWLFYNQLRGVFITDIKSDIVTVILILIALFRIVQPSYDIQNTSNLISPKNIYASSLPPPPPPPPSQWKCELLK